MVIPVHDTNPTHRTPVVTYLLLALNVVAFLIGPIATAPLLGGQDIASACSQEAFFREYAAIPRELLTNEQLPEAVGPPSGPSSCALVRPDYDKSPALSVLTAMFLHGGWLHLLGNMLFLFVFGNNVEDRLGRVRFTVFYLVCGYAATYAYALANADSETSLVGASGAIAGVLGAYLVLFPRARVLGLLSFLFFLPVRLPAWIVLGSWFLLQYLYTQGAGLSAGSNVAYLAHVMGFVAGALLVLPLRDRPHPADRRPAPGPYGPYGRR